MNQEDRALVSCELVRLIFDYDQSTGLLIWKKRPEHTFRQTEKRSAEHTAKLWNARYAGTCAGTANPDGYLIVFIQGRPFLVAHVIWLYMTGEWPTKEVDHRDRTRTNNRWSNLRLATRSENCTNTARKSLNTSGFKNVCWDPQSSKWRARITVNGSRKHLGRFQTREEAFNAAQKAAKQYLGEFANAG